MNNGLIDIRYIAHARRWVRWDNKIPFYTEKYSSRFMIHDLFKFIFFYRKHGVWLMRINKGNVFPNSLYIYIRIVPKLIPIQKKDFILFEIWTRNT